MRKRIFAGIVLVIAGLAAGCGGGGNITGDLGREVGICFGRVIDRSSRSGIADATVEIFAGAIPSKNDNTPKGGSDDVNFVVKTTTVSDDSDTTLFNEAGMFRFQNLPTGETTGYRVRVSATNYATMQTTCTFGVTSSDNTPIAEDLGDLQMVRAVSVTVNLLNNGAAVASCPVFALPGASAEGATLGQGTTVLAGVEVSGTTDTSGQVTLAGLNPLIAYTIVAPACDTDADLDYDTQTAALAVDSFIDSNTTVALEAISASRDDALALVDVNATLVADSGDQFAAVMDIMDDLTAGLTTVGGVDDILSIGTSTNLIFVFNFPVAVGSTPGIGLDFINNLVATGAATFPVFTSVDMTCTLGGGSTVLTCDPASDLTVNELYTLDGTVVANLPSGTNATAANTTFNVGDLDADGTIDSWYIFDASSTGWVASSAPTADNYNAVSTGAAGADLVYLEFPELVYGTWRVTSFTDNDPNNDGSTADAATTSQIQGALNCSGNLTTAAGWLFQANDPDTAGVVTGTASDGTMQLDGTNEQAGSGTGIVYRVPLTAAACSTGGDINLNDTEAASARTVTVYVSATDVEGNTVEGESTLAVQ